MLPIHLKGVSRHQLYLGTNDFIATQDKYYNKDGSLQSRASATVESVQNILNSTNISLKTIYMGLMSIKKVDC